jgi:ubiquinone biosynthesis protein Coq4
MAVQRLYPSHVPTGPAARLLLTAGTALGAFLYPQRADLVAAFGELTGSHAFTSIRARMAADPTGQLLLREKPVVTVCALHHALRRMAALHTALRSRTCTPQQYAAGPALLTSLRTQALQNQAASSDRHTCVLQDAFLESCRRAPAGSFGQAYADYMSNRRFHANERPPVRFIDDPEVAYVATRYRQVHDFWHVLFDCHTSLLGEAALKAVEFAQVRCTSLVLASRRRHNTCF